MKIAFLLFIAVLVGTTARAFSEDAPKKPVELRKPGFLFMELGTTHGEDYAAFFESVGGYHLVRHEPGFIMIETALAQILLTNPSGLSKGHPFYHKVKDGNAGIGVEVGLVVADLDKAFAEAVKFKDKGFKISAGIGMRPWGVRDFRVLAPDGYYLRFTEGPK